jgi:hypothetical protein
MQSVLLQISVQLRFLALRLHIVRCRLLANSEDDRATQKQLLSLLHALEGAEVQLRKEYNRVYVTPGATGDTAPILRTASPRIHDVAGDSKDSQSHTVIDLNAARNARTRHSRPFLSHDFRPDPLTR